MSTIGIALRMSVEIGEDVCVFIKKFLAFPRDVVPSDALVSDLCIDGGDAVDLIGAFAVRFAVDMTGFNFGDYFGPEMPPGLETLLIMWRIRCGESPEAAARLHRLEVQELIAAARVGRWVLQR